MEELALPAGGVDPHFIAELLAAEVARARPESGRDLSRVRDRLDGLLQTADGGLVLADASGQLLYANAAAAALHGFPSGVTLVSASTQELEAHVAVLDEWDQPVSPARLPLLALRAPEAPELLLRFFDRRAREERWATVHASPLRDEHNRILALVAVYRDQTEQRRSEEALRLLARAGALLAGPLELRAVLDAIGRIALTALADECEVQLLPQDAALGWPSRAFLHAGGGVRLADGPAPAPLERSELHGELFATTDERFTPLLRAGCTSGLAVPLQNLGRTSGSLGTLILGAGPMRRRYGPRELALAEDLAARIASALEGARHLHDAQLVRAGEARRLSALELAHRISSTLQREQRPANGLTSCLEMTRRQLGAQLVRLWSTAEGGARLEVQASSADPDSPHLGPLEAFEVKKIAASRAERSVANLMADPILSALGPGSFTGLPLFANGQCAGVLALFFARPPPSDLEELLAPALELLALGLQRRLAEAAGQSARDQIALESQRKDEFLAMLAHELRNPLAPIVTALQLMRTRDGDGKSVARERNLIERQVGHLTRLVDDLLDVSRVSRGKLELRKEPVDLSSVVGRAVEAAQPLMARFRHTLTVSLPEEPLFLVADPVRLAQVVLNLLNNAAKYTPVGGRIRLTVERAGESALVRVRDTGIGIPRDLQPRIFDLFVQAGGGPEHSRGGLGIGLSLVRALVELHGGEVTVASGGRDTGSEFTVRLPALPDHDLGLPLPPPPGQPVLDSGEGRRVLVVDDNRDAAEMLAEALNLWGCEVRVVNDGAAALEAAAERTFDIILLDIGMPGMNGYEVARRLRKVPALDGVRLVAITGYGREMDYQQSRDAGFDLHLTKPVELDVLQRTILSAQGPPAAGPRAAPVSAPREDEAQHAR